MKNILSYELFLEKKFNAPNYDLLSKRNPKKGEIEHVSPYTDLYIDPVIEEQFKEILLDPNSTNHYRKSGHVSYAMVQSFCRKYGYEFGGHEIAEKSSMDVYRNSKNADMLTYIYNETFYPERNKNYRKFRNHVIRNN